MRLNTSRHWPRLSPFQMPSLRRPTVSKLADEEWVAVETIICESVARSLIPDLKELGAEGIIEYPLNKIVL